MNFKHRKEKIYTEMEVSYYISVLKKVAKKKYDGVMTREELAKIIKAHDEKALKTLKVLMGCISLGYFFEKVNL